ncbi:protein terminal ear1-like [Macadamia integrifolia]|uniref:protein terminal ear1-like n=1 Tax=Macadamia integrifolia TaxID=60698 RepID=UPI001C4E2E92|nr:protein terminal ear1-like [Macadamia integrifolia]
MDESRIVRFTGQLDPQAEEFKPRISSPQNQVSFLRPPQMYYPFSSSASYPSTTTTSGGVPMMPTFYGASMNMGYHQSLHASAPYVGVGPTRGNQPPLPPLTLPPPSPTATRVLLLSSVSTDVSETTVRRELEVFGEVRSVQMERLNEGVITVQFYDLRHAQAALVEIREQHMKQQIRLRQHYTALQKQHINFSFGLENFAPPLLPSAPGLIAGRPVWAQFTVPGKTIGQDGHNQGTLVVFNLDLEVSSSKLKEIFEAFGPVKELRETPSKRYQRFVEFFDIRDAARALSEMKGKEIHGKHVIIEFSRPGGHGRRYFNSDANASAPNLNLSNGVKSGNNYNMKFAKHPSPKPTPSLPPRLLGRSSSDAIPCHITQTIKKSSYRDTAGSNRKSDYAGRTEAKGSLSLTVASNGVVDERDHSGTWKNGRKSNSHGNYLSTSTKQMRSRSWKGRHKNTDAHFLISEDALVESDIRDTRTTVMIKNIPNKYSQKLLLNMLDNHCIHCNEQIADGDGQPLSSYDFVYLPIDFNNKCNVGYGFVNFTSTQATLRLYKAFHMQPWEVFNSRKICQITYARLQGLEALKDHFKNSQFPCEVDEYLPVVFSPPRDGKQLTEPLAIGGYSKPVIIKGVNGRVKAINDGDCGGVNEIQGEDREQRQL